MTSLQHMLYNAIKLGDGYTLEDCLEVAKTAFDTDLPRIEVAVGRLIKLGKVELEFTENNNILLRASK